MDLWAIQNLTEITFIPCLYSYCWSPLVIAHSILYCGIRCEDRIGFQWTRNTIACLQFDHAQQFQSTTDRFTLQLCGEFKVIPLKLFYYQTFFETWHN